MTTSGSIPTDRATLPTSDVRIEGHGTAAYIGSGNIPGKAWRVTTSVLVIIASIDDTPAWGPLLHVSLSYALRDPSWLDIKAVKDAFFGAGRDAMMVLPRQEDYISLHPHAFHLWETPQVWGLR